MKMRKQRLMGVLLVALSWATLLIAGTGRTVEEQDATGAVLTLPLGLYMIYTETYVLYEGPADKAAGLCTTHQKNKKGAAAWQERE